MKKLAVVISSLEVGGAERMVLDLVKQIKDKINVKLFVIKSNSHSIYDKEASRLGVELIYFNHKIKILSLFVVFRFIKEMNRFKPDIIHSHLKASTYVYFYYLFNKQFKWIHTVHTLANIDTKCIRRQFFKPLYNNNKLVIVAVSDKVKESIKRIYPKSDVVTIYNGINLERFKSNNKNNTKEINLVSVGRLAKEKNHEYLLKELIGVRGLVDKVYLIGDGKERWKLEEIIKQKALDSNVIMIKFTNRVIYYLANSKIYLCSSLYEGHPISIIEAMASGLIVIASKAASELITNNYNGFIIDLEKGELENKIAFVINNLDKLDYIKENAKKTVSCLSIENMANSYLSLYIGDNK